MRYFLKFSYNGTNYHGWQVQPNAASVQQCINHALSTVLNSNIEVVGAGRTDAGVHAREMFAHFDFHAALDEQIIYKLNSFLPKDIAIHRVYNVHDSAHARFDAKSRTYQYHIHQQKDPFLQSLSWHHAQPLDHEAMNAAAQLLFEYNDFQCFSKVNTDVNTFNCRIFEARWSQVDSQLIFTISADRFLRNMVRAIVGTLVQVGLHKISPKDFETIIKSRDRRNAGASAPAHGLFLTRIRYDYINSPD